MGNQHLYPCPIGSSLDKQATSELIFTHKSSQTETMSVKQFKHSIQIQGPSEVYKKSLRKDLNTVELADQILVSFDIDKCFISSECGSLIDTKATQDSLHKRQVPVLTKKTLYRKKTKVLLTEVSG